MNIWDTPSPFPPLLIICAVGTSVCRTGTLRRAWTGGSTTGTGRHEVRTRSSGHESRVRGPVPEWRELLSGRLPPCRVQLARKGSPPAALEKTGLSGRGSPRRSVKVPARCGPARIAERRHGNMKPRPSFFLTEPGWSRPKCPQMTKNVAASSVLIKDGVQSHYRQPKLSLWCIYKGIHAAGIRISATIQLQSLRL